MRRISNQVFIGNIVVGGSAPIVVQSMTNTDTADIESTVTQVRELAQAGSELVRVTVNNEAAARSVPYIREKLDAMGCAVPLIGDFHYNGHILLKNFPEMAVALAKYRINPGNVGFADKHDAQFLQMIEAAIKYSKPVRIGVNWGSLDQQVLAAGQHLGDVAAGEVERRELGEPELTPAQGRTGQRGVHPLRGQPDGVSLGHAASVPRRPHLV